LRIETHTYIHPEHYEEDKEAQAMYERVLEILAGLPDPTEEEWNKLRLQMVAEVQKKQREKGRDE
jgi:hypothetical protein